MIYCPNWDSTQELPRALPSGTPSGEGVYLTVCPLSRPNTNTVCDKEPAGTLLIQMLRSLHNIKIYSRAVRNVNQYAQRLRVL